MKAMLAVAATLLALILPARARAERPSWRMFLEYDYFAPSNSGEGLSDQLQGVSDRLKASGTADSTEWGVSARAGSGSRVGVLFPLDRRTQLGASIGYVLGPTMNSDFASQSSANGKGGLTVNRAASYVRALGQSRVDLFSSGRWAAALESDFGIGIGHVDESCSSSGALSCAGNVATAKKTWTGFTWGFALAVSRDFDFATLSFGPRYAGFPRFQGDEQLAPIRWESFGLFLAAAF